MAHPYAIQPVTSGSIQNGSIITFVTEATDISLVSKRSPDINSFISSGILNPRVSGRFDEHYGGGAS